MTPKLTYAELEQQVKALKAEASKRKKSEEALGQIFDMSLDMICIADIHSATFLKINSAFTDTLGFTEKELLGRPFLDFVHPEDIAATKKVIEERLGRGEKVINFQNRYHHKDGSYRWLKWVSHPKPDQGITFAVAHDITEEKHASEILKNSALQWQTTFDAVNDSICVLDSQWNILQANRATTRILNKSRKEVIGRKCYELIHDSAEAIATCPVRRIAETRRRETEILQIGGRWFEVTADPIFDRQGEFQGAVHIITDIEKRKRSEAALKQGEETLRSIFRAAPTGIGMVCDRIITRANDRLCEMVGRSREELLGKSARILYPTEKDYDYVGRVKYDQIRKHGTGTVESRWQHKDGRILDVLLSSTPVNPDDWSEGVTFTALDITERKQTEEKLRASHEMFLTVLDSIEATIYVADMNTHEILFMNKHMIDSFGKDLTGQHCWKAFRNEFGPCRHCSNEKLLDHNGQPTGVYVWQGENPITGKWYVNYDRAIKWVDDRWVRIQIATDITELKHLETQLQQSQRLEAIGNLAGGIAHDFNNILSAVIGYSELSLADIEKGSPLETNLVEIQKAGLRARDLVKQILTFARRAEQDLKPVKVSSIAAEAMKLLRSTLPTSVEIQSRMDSDSLVMADPSQLHQIFMNLCTNAAHAMEPDGGILSVRLTDYQWPKSTAGATGEIEPGDYIQITVADNGQGIPEENLPLIFEPYFTTKPTGEGTGLGLSVVHGIVKKSRGDILVKSEVGHGTEFTIYLPVIQRDADSRPFATDTLQKGDERILFVDDEQAICNLGSQMLERLGYQVTVRTSSIEALTLFRANPENFDLVITDMTMPNLNGDKLAVEMLAIRPGMPIILCTGYSKAISERKAHEIGIKALAMKPITIVDLSQTIRKILDT